MTGRGPGASNRRAGLKRWQFPCARWLAAHGWPLAASSNRGPDLVAGPVAIDCADTTWDKIWAKLDKMIGQGAAAGLPYACVWKKRHGRTDPAQGMVMMRADQFWGLVGRLEAAEDATRAAERDLERAERRWMERERVS